MGPTEGGSHTPRLQLRPYEHACEERGWGKGPPIKAGRTISGNHTGSGIVGVTTSPSKNPCKHSTPDIQKDTPKYGEN